MEPKNKPTLADLKAQAYDCMVNIERWQQMLRSTNQAIVEFKPEVEEEKEEIKEEGKE